MRCSAKRVTKHKVTFSFENGSASGTYTSSGGIRRHLPLEGKAKSGRAARTADERFLPRIRKLSPLCTKSLSLAAPGLPVPWGGSGGVSRSRRSPLSGLSFSLFFFLRERKRGLRRRCSHKISVAKAKTDSEPSPPRGSQSTRGLRLV